MTIHKEILAPEQAKLLPLINAFKKQFVLVGGTAIALYLGHRQSIDFDLFATEKFKTSGIRNKIKTKGFNIDHVIRDQIEDYTVVVESVKCTFFYYPFPLKAGKKLDGGIGLPDLITLAAMKAHALGRRAKWKDYVDLYFIFTKHYRIDEVTKKAKNIFGSEFNEKNFRVGLSYFKDIDYSEEINYLPEMSVPDSIIKNELAKISRLG